MGKRGGGRVIYYVALGTDRFYMMAAYPKSERDDLSTEQRRRILAGTRKHQEAGKLAMVLPNKARGYRRRRPIELERKSRKSDRLRQGGSRVKGSRVGDDLVAAFEEMAQHLRGEIELEAHDLPSGTMTPAQIKAVRLKVASSTKEFERLFGIPARTMESYEQGRRKLDGAMRALLRIIDREPKVACRALTR